MTHKKYRAYAYDKIEAKEYDAGEYDDLDEAKASAEAKAIEKRMAMRWRCCVDEQYVDYGDDHVSHGGAPWRKVVYDEPRYDPADEWREAE